MCRFSGKDNELSSSHFQPSGVRSSGQVLSQRVFRNRIRGACRLTRHVAVRRVFQQEIVPAAEKMMSIFEPHMDIIRRNKAHEPTDWKITQLGL